MTRSATVPTEQLRPNPFAFASDTTFRFVLLIVGIVGVIPRIWQQLWLNINADRAIQLIMHCEATSPSRGFVIDRVRALDDYEYAAQAYNDFRGERLAVMGCLDPIFGTPLALASFAGLAATFGLAAAIYLATPRWIIRRRRLKALPFDVQPRARAEVDRVEPDAGVAAVKYLIAAHSQTAGAVAFGRIGRRYVALDRGLVKCAEDDPLVFRGVLRHELAHFANHDVDKSYFTVAVWGALVVVGLVPFVVLKTIHELTGSTVHFWAHSWRVVALVALVYLVRNAILRARESYADVRAAQWDRGDGGLVSSLARPVNARRAFWPPVLFRMHPSPSSRRTAVENPHSMLGVGFWDSVAAGLVATIGYEAVSSVAVHLGADESELWTGLIYGPLIAGVIGLAIWRAAYADYVVGTRRALRPHRVGLGLGLGLAVGPFTLLSNAGGEKFENIFGEPAPSIAVIGGSLIVVIGIWALVQWISAASTVWMPTVVRKSSPRMTTFTAATVFSLVCAQAVTIVLDMRDSTILNSGPGVPNTAFNEILVPLFPKSDSNPWLLAGSLVVLTALWSYPLIGGRQSASGPTAAWSTLNGPRPAFAHQEGRSRHLARATGIGLGAAMMACAGILIYRAQVLANSPTGPPLDQDLASNYNGIVIAIVSSAQVMAGLVAAITITALRVSHALCAATITGVLSGSAAIPFFLGENGQATQFDLAEAVLYSGYVLRPALVVTLLAALVVAGIAALTRRAWRPASRI